MIRNTRRWAAGVVLAGILCGRGAADGWEMPSGTSVRLEDPRSAAELLEECRARMPLDPLRMTGWISMRRPRGIVSKEFDFTVELHWGGEPPLARYTVSERGGPILEQVMLRKGEDGRLTLLRMVGPQLEPAPAPEWNDRIQGSDVTWLDVTLGFLWWDDPRLVGEDTVRGRLCDLVEVVPPTPVPGCARIRLWLDRELKLLLQAKEFDFEGGVTRQMWVRSVKKMGDRWMVRDVEVQGRGSGHRTRLHVSDVNDSASP